MVKWLGITYDQHNTDDFHASRNYGESSHGGSLIFRYFNRNGFIDDNKLYVCGDDGIAINSTESSGSNDVEARYITINGNRVGEKVDQDIQQPWNDRYRAGSSPFITIGASEATKNVIVDTFDGNNGELGHVNPDHEGNPQPAVDVETRGDLGMECRDIKINYLRIDPEHLQQGTKGKGLRVW